jgi:hypothetical protein
MLLLLAREMVPEEGSVYGIFEAAQNGYIVEKADRFLERLAGFCDEHVDFVYQLIFGTPLPDNAEVVLDRLEAMTGSLWPPNPGHIIRRVGDTLMIDLYSATRRLNNTLLFDLTGKTKEQRSRLSEQRGKHFEAQVQRMIDNSPWGDVPERLRALRQRRHLKRHDGNPLSNIDAIGVFGDTALIVECKSKIQTDDVVLGTYRAARSQAKRLEEEIIKCREREQYLRAHPRRSRKGGYDFSEFKNLVVVLCTPAPVYVEFEMVRNAGLEATKLLSTDEVAPGLSAAVSLFELEKWLWSSSASN